MTRLKPKPRQPPDENSKLLEGWFKDNQTFLLGYLHRTFDKNRITPQDVQDLAQDIWLALRRRSGSLRRVKNVQAYVVTTGKRAGIRFVKRRTQEQAALAVDPADHSDGVLSELIIKEGVQEALARLSERHRTILKMKYVAGMTTAEIADACEMKEDSVERELTAARRLLKPLLANHLKGRHS